MKKKYAIIEDEAYACQSLQRAVRRLRPDYEMIFSANSVKEGVERIEKETDLDLIFMDIELSDGTCFEIFDSVHVGCPIIFTTAYDEYAIRAFKVDSIDYLLKPVGDPELSLALTKFERMVGKAEDVKTVSIVNNEITKKGDSEINRILLVNGDSFNWAAISDVRLIESEDDYVFVTLSNGKRSMAAQRSLSKIMAMLSSETFFQVDRSTIVSILAINSVSKYFKGRLLVKVSIGGSSKSYTVSSSRRNEFLKWLGK